MGEIVVHEVQGDGGRVFSILFEKPLIGRVNRRIGIRMVGFCCSTPGRRKKHRADPKGVSSPLLYNLTPSVRLLKAAEEPCGVRKRRVHSVPS